MTGILQNLRYAFRLLHKRPGFTAIAVITLALGIGANTAIFSVIYSALLAPLPYPNSDQLVMVWSKVQDDRNVVAVADFLDWKRENTVFQDLGAFTSDNFNLATPERPEQVEGGRTTPGFYNMIGEKFALGRDFMADEGEKLIPWWRCGTSNENPIREKR
jgi:putative ABC transport system permease protein